MVKKIQKTAEPKPAAPAGLFDSQLAQTVRDSAQQIWLAGLGAFAKSPGGGGKVFETLIKEGISLQRKTQAAAEEKLVDVADKMTAMADEVGHKANAHWDKLETIFEERTARALGRLGVPSAKQLATLAARVDALTAEVAKLGGAASADPVAAKPARKLIKAVKSAAPAKTPAAQAKPVATRRVARKKAAPAG